jgi:hypothetical protein
LVTALIYRSFRRRVLLATAGLFALGLVAALLLRQGGSIWTVTLWMAVSSPVLVALAIVFLVPIRRVATQLGLTGGPADIRLRSPVAIWTIVCVLLPWTAAWLMADLAGAWYIAWRAAQAGADGGLLLWATRAFAGVATYSLASAIGLVFAFLTDRDAQIDDIGEEPF